MTVTEQNNRPVKTILAALDNGSYDAEASIDELAELADTAGAIVAGKVIQRREAPEKATFVGVGKLAEIIAFCKTEEIDIIIVDSELSPSQQRNLEKLTGVRVIDRTMLILDIFAGRANTREGKLQVELAQLQYRMPRLTGFGKSLSRLGGGIGTRGPGEKKLETDRRHIAGRIDDIKAELKKMNKNRAVQRAGREKSNIPALLTNISTS